MASDTGNKKLKGEEDVEVEDGGVSISCGYDAVTAPIATVLSVIQRDAPETFKAWVDEHMTDTLDAHYDAGFGDGYRLGFGEGPRA